MLCIPFLIFTAIEERDSVIGGGREMSSGEIILL